MIGTPQYGVMANKLVSQINYYSVTLAQSAGAAEDTDRISAEG